MNIARSSSLSTLEASEVSVCVLHASEHVHDCPFVGLPIAGIKLMTGMADFADCQGTVTYLWIDARMTWRFPGFSAFPMLQPCRDLRVFIYNCEYLAPELLTLEHPQLRFVEGNIHSDLLQRSQQHSALIGL